MLCNIGGGDLFPIMTVDEQKCFFVIEIITGAGLLADQLLIHDLVARQKIVKEPHQAKFRVCLGVIFVKDLVKTADELLGKIKALYAGFLLKGAFL